MHPLLAKILIEGNASLKDFQSLQLVPIEELPELMLVRNKNLVWESFIRCKAEYQRRQRKLIRQGERMLKNPALITRKRSTVTSTTTTTLPQPSFDEQEIDAGRAAQIDENLPGTSNTCSEVVPCSLMEHEIGIPAIGVTTLEDLLAPSGIMESIQDHQVTTSAPTMPEEHLELSALPIAFGDDNPFALSTAIIANDVVPGPNLVQSMATNSDPTPGPSTEPLNGVSAVPIAPRTLTPLPRQEELTGLTLLPLRKKRKAAAPLPMTQITFSHFYARPGKPDFGTVREPLSSRPLYAPLIDVLRALSVEEALRIGQIWLTGAPVPPPAAISPTTTTTPQVIDYLAVSTPDQETPHIPLPPFGSLNEDVSRISIDRQVEQSLAGNIPSFISGPGTMTSSSVERQHITSRRMFAEEPSVEKIKFLQDLWTKLQTTNRVPFEEVIRSTDTRLDAAWKFGILVEFDSQLWRMEKVEGTTSPCAVCRWLK